MRKLTDRQLAADRQNRFAEVEINDEIIAGQAHGIVAAAIARS